VQISTKLAALLNKLVEPNPDKRLGARSGGIKELREHEWFEEIMWGDLPRGVIPAPHQAKASELVESCHAAIETAHHETDCGASEGGERDAFLAREGAQRTDGHAADAQGPRGTLDFELQN